MVHRISKAQGGFTLIELLVTASILAALAGVAVPVAVQFTGSSQTKAAAAELDTIQEALESMMVDQGISTLPDPGPGVSGTCAPQPEMPQVTCRCFPTPRRVPMP